MFFNKEFFIGWIWVASVGPVGGMLSFSLRTYLDLGITLAAFPASIGYNAYHYLSNTSARLVIGFVC